MVLAALVGLAFINAQLACGIVEFRKWSPKGTEPFYAKALGFSSDQSEFVLERHEDSKTIRVKITELSGEDLKYAKSFMSQAMSTGNSDGDNVSNLSDNRWELGGFISIKLPRHARGWRFIDKSPLSFAAVGLEDPALVVMSCTISEPMVDAKSVTQYLKQLGDRSFKLAREQGMDRLSEPPVIKEVTADRFGMRGDPNQRRQFEGSAQAVRKGEVISMKVLVYQEEYATVAFVAIGNDQVTSNALEVASQFVYRPTAATHFAKKPPPKVTGKQLSEIKKSVKQLTADVKKKDAAYIFENCLHPKSVEQMKQNGEYDQRLRTFDAAGRPRLLQALESIRWNTAQPDKYQDEVVVFQTGVPNDELRLRKLDNQWRLQ